METGKNILLENKQEFMDELRPALHDAWSDLPMEDRIRKMRELNVLAKNAAMARRKS